MIDSQIGVLSGTLTCSCRSCPHCPVIVKPDFVSIQHLRCTFNMELSAFFFGKLFLSVCCGWWSWSRLNHMNSIAYLYEVPFYLLNSLTFPSDPFEDVALQNGCFKEFRLLHLLVPNVCSFCIITSLCKNPKRIENETYMIVSVIICRQLQLIA